jgi:hypothetical protein
MHGQTYFKFKTDEYLIFCVISLRERMGQLFSERELIVFAQLCIALRVAKLNEKDKN